MGPSGTFTIPRKRCREPCGTLRLCFQSRSMIHVGTKGPALLLPTNSDSGDQDGDRWPDNIRRNTLIPRICCIELIYPSPQSVSWTHDKGNPSPGVNSAFGYDDRENSVVLGTSISNTTYAQEVTTWNTPLHSMSASRKRLGHGLRPHVMLIVIVV